MTIAQRDRKDVVAAIERAGVVAVIRLKDPAVLAGVVDALVAGGVHMKRLCPRAKITVCLSGETLAHAGFGFSASYFSSRTTVPVESS